MDPSALPLREWHGPEAPGWWPPAPGWWMLFVLAIVLLAGLAWIWWRILHPSPKKLARKELENLRLNPDLSKSERIRALSMLIRRICLSVYPRSASAHLTGGAWLAFLDQGLEEPLFSQGPGRVLVDAPYRRETDTDPDALFQLCARWIDTLPEKPPRSVSISGPKPEAG